MKRLAIPDRFLEHGTQPELYRECGIDDIAVVEAVKEMLGEKRAVKGIKASA